MENVENNRYPYLIKVDEKIAGLILISDYPEVPEESTDFVCQNFSSCTNIEVDRETH